MSNNTNETFQIEELALSNRHLLPNENKKAIYFVTVMQGETKKIIYVGFTENLRKNFASHKRRMEFEFLTRLEYQISIFWIVLPEETSHEEGHAAQRCYIRTFEPKLNDNYNTIGCYKLKNPKNRMKILSRINMDIWTKKLKTGSKQEMTKR